MMDPELARKAEEATPSGYRWCHRPEFMAAYQNRVYEIGKLLHPEAEEGEREPVQE